MAVFNPQYRVDPSRIRARITNQPANDENAIAREIMQNPTSNESRGQELLGYLQTLNARPNTVERAPSPAPALSQPAHPTNTLNPTEMLNEITKWGQYHLQPLVRRTAASNSKAASGGTISGNSTWAKFLRAIKAQESGGNYGAVNRSSGALGAYQVMPANVPNWSRKVLGHSITPSQFLHNPALQDQIAQAMLKSYYNKYGARGAAEAWYGGPGSIGRSYVRGYSNSILRRMGLR